MTIRTATILSALFLASPALAQDNSAPATPPAGEAATAAPTKAAPQEAGQETGAMIAEIKTADGESLGTATAAPTPSGAMLVTLELANVPPGIHGAHIHQTGTCTPPDFESAGGHLADGKQHGIMDAGGPHPGDMPNIHVPESGELTIEFFVAGLTAAQMADEDGSALVLHEQPDDYVGQPSGNAGPRLACGSFAAAE